MATKTGGTAIEKAIYFIQWMDAQRTLPDYRAVMDRFDVAKATAYRWLAAYRDCRLRSDECSTISSTAT